LDFSKIESGKAEIAETSFNLGSLMDKVLGFAKHMSEGRGLNIQLKVDPSAPHYITGDKLRLRQILVNLVGNAVKFTPGGSVTIALRLIDKSKQTTDRNHLKLQFDVIDTGIGIPDDRLSCLFKAFSQVDLGMTRKYGGFGLGLAISKKLCEAMGGEMWVKSKENIGTTFSSLSLLVTPRISGLPHRNLRSKRPQYSSQLP